MKLKYLIAGICLSLVATTASWAGGRTVYIGAKTGTMDVSFEEFDDATNRGYVLGYMFHDDPSGSVALELEATTPTSKSDLDAGFFGMTEWELDTQALYFAYRSGGTAYFKGKIGLLEEDLDAGVLGTETDQGLSLGAGFGIKLGEHLSTEAEFTIIEQDVNYLSIGVNLHF